MYNEDILEIKNLISPSQGYPKTSHTIIKVKIKTWVLRFMGSNFMLHQSLLVNRLLGANSTWIKTRLFYHSQAIVITRIKPDGFINT